MNDLSRRDAKVHLHTIQTNLAALEMLLATNRNTDVLSKWAEVRGVERARC